jgi:hypothetical protein
MRDWPVDLWALLCSGIRVPGTAAKSALKDLAQRVISAVAATGSPIEELRGIAFFDPRRDAILTAQESFSTAVSAVSELPLLADRFGSAEAHRLVLQFVYGFCGRLSQAAFDETAFENTWRAFSQELEEPTWTYRGVANVRYLRGAPAAVDLGSGVTIRGRNFEELNALGFGEEMLNRLREDWSGPGASSFVMMVERIVPKRPDNMVQSNDPSLWENALRALRALRLLAPGEISIGRMWVIRPGHFNVGLGGLVSQGYSIPNLGREYELTNDVAESVSELCSELLQLEQAANGRSPGNLELALGSFMQTYDRWPSLPNSQLLDSITALEAVLGTETEIAFKLAFRVAGLLAGNDVERSVMLQDVKGFYDTRSRLVHGGRLNAKNQGFLTRVDELRSFVRRLLSSFVRMAVQGSENYNKRFFAEQLDAALINASERERLRREFRLA